MQNLRYYCRQRIEALADKQCKFGCICRVRFKHIIVQSEYKISKLKNVKEPLYIFFFNVKEIL